MKGFIFIFSVFNMYKNFNEPILYSIEFIEVETITIERGSLSIFNIKLKMTYIICAAVLNFSFSFSSMYLFKVFELNKGKNTFSLPYILFVNWPPLFSISI